MEITEAKIKLMPARSDRLQAFCTITLDNDFVIRDIKIIEGAKGAFVAMPSRKLTDKCPKCSGKNHLRSRFCNDCGGRLDENRASKDKRGRAKLHADIAHPINSVCRERLQARILEAFHAEVEKSKQPGYVAPKLEEDEDVASDLDPFDGTQAPPLGAGSEVPLRVNPEQAPALGPGYRRVDEQAAEERREPPREVVRAPEPEPAPAPQPVPRPELAPAPQPAPKPEPAPEPAAELSDEDEDIRRLEEEVRRYEEREEREAEKKKDKKDDFAAGLF